MIKLLVFTDLHLRDSTIIGLNPVERFKEGLDHALSNHPDAAGVVLMGDLSHSGTVSEYQLLKSITDNVDLPITFMMGNHDRREPFLEIFSDAVIDDDGYLQSSFDIGDWRAICIDGLDGPPYPKGHHSGRLCEDRIKWLSNELVNAQDKPIAIFMHHPIGNVGFPGMDCIKMINGLEIQELLNGHPKPVHIFAGHVHRTMSGQWNGIPYTMYKSPCHQQPLDFEMENSALAVDEPGAYGLIIFDGNSLIAHTEDFALAKMDHSPDLDVEG